MSEFSVITLGCGSAKPSLRHNPSSTVVDFRGNLFMIDCGEGTQLQMMRSRLKFSRLGHIFLTHLHGDHVLGLPGLISTLDLQSTGGSLTIHTIAEGKRMIDDMLGYFARHIDFKINYNILDPEKEEIAFDNHAMTVRTLPLHHRVPTLGFIFEEKPRPRHLDRAMCDFHGISTAYFNRIKAGEDYVKPDGTIIPNSRLTKDATPSLSYAHISDTAFDPKIAEAIGPVDLLFHETTYLERDAAFAIPRGHSTARQAAEAARIAGARWLLTGHYSTRYNDDEQFRREALQIHPRVITNREGLVVDLTRLP